VYVADTNNYRIQAFGTAYPSTWRGEYFPNRWLTGAPALIRNEARINFDWWLDAPGPGLPADEFSARWYRHVWLRAGTYRFRLYTDDGVRLWVDDRLLVEAWQDPQMAWHEADIELESGYHFILLEYYEAFGAAAVQLSWEPMIKNAFLPLIVRSPLPCDAYEPNDDRRSNPWGPLRAGETYRAKLCRGDVEDNYYLEAGTSQPLRITLNLPDSIARWTTIWVYHGSNLDQPVCGRAPGVMAAGVVHTLECPLSQAGRYVIRLYTDDANIHYDNVQEYSLRADFAPFATPTPTPTYTSTPTPTSTRTPTSTSTSTPTPTPTRTPTPTPTPTPLPAPITIVLQNGLEGYAGTTDTWINDEAPDTNYNSGSSASFLIVGSNNHQSALIRFDLSAIPSNAYILSAVLELNFRQATNSNPLTVDIFRLRRNWSDAEATWRRATSSTLWEVPGANGPSDREMEPAVHQVVTGVTGQWVSFDVTNIVQSWVSGAVANRGMLLQGASGGGVKYTFCSSQFPASEGWRRPRLTIRYTTALGSWQTITSQNFEGTFPGSWRILDNNGTNYGEYYWAKRNCRSFAGSFSGWAAGGGANGSSLPCGSNYPDYMDSWMIFGPFSLADATAAELRFRAWLNSESGYDFLCWGASLNGYSFYSYCDTGNSGGWVERTLDLSNVYSLGNLLGQPQVWVALIFESDGSITYPEGAYVDNIELRKCVGGYCPPAVAQEEPATGLSTRPMVLFKR
jgi:hypothetical protein